MLNLDPITLISRLITLVIALTVHEFSHAKVADAFGDNTPRMNGRVTLNPLVHLDPFGSLMMVFAGFGWAKPVPVNPVLLGMRSPSAYMLVSLAGPLSNLMLAILASFLYGISDEIHQAFVPMRSCDVFDALFDLLGAVLGAGLFSLIRITR